MLQDVATGSSNIWAFRAHPEIWLLIGSLTLAYIYMARRIGPHAVPAGQPAVTRRQWGWFAGGMLMLWVASDWPMHDVGEQSSYATHMLQHMMLSYFIPPMLLLATPEWLARLVIGEGRVYRAVHWFTRPVVAGVIFNLMVMITHIPGLVNAAVADGRASALLHYSLHFGVVLTSLLMWMPVCGPLPERRIGYGGMMIYLFVQSIVPTVPAGWLTFAEGAVYKAYDIPQHLFGLSVTHDQQLAGAIMKIGGSIFLWTLTTILFFKRFMRNWESENARPGPSMPRAELRRDEDPELTYAQVQDVFAATAAPEEPVR